MLTVLLKKHTCQDTWYLFQVTDGDGYPQVRPTPTPVALGAESGTSPAQLSFCASLGFLGPLCPHPGPAHQHLSHSGRMHCSVSPGSVLSFRGLSFPSWEMSSRALNFATPWPWGSDSPSCIFPNPTQISLEVNSQEQSLELRARSHDGDFVSCSFAVPQLFDLRWHKLQLSVAGRVASVHVDCTSASSQPLGPRRPVRPVGHVFLGLDAEQAKPVSVSARPGSGLCFGLESVSAWVLPLLRILSRLPTNPPDAA